MCVYVELITRVEWDMGAWLSTQLLFKHLWLNYNTDTDGMKKKRAGETLKKELIKWLRINILPIFVEDKYFSTFD